MQWKKVDENPFRAPFQDADALREGVFRRGEFYNPDEDDFGDEIDEGSEPANRAAADSKEPSTGSPSRSRLLAGRVLQ